MKSLKVLTLLLNFGVIAFIGLKSLSTECLSWGDLSLSLMALIFSVMVEIKNMIGGKK